MDPKKTGNIIFEARRQANMTQKELADKLYVSDKAVSKWERGLCFPDIAVLIPLTEVLNISLYDLLRGEKVNKKEVEETLKNTINYSNSELNRKKKKYFAVCSAIVVAVLIISAISIILISNNNEMKPIVKKDAIHEINYYSKYKTSINDENGEKVELLLMKLPLNWKERTFNIDDNKININYEVSYDKVVKTYKDKEYVNSAIIDIATVLFTIVSDVDNITIRFTDYNYSISKEDMKNVYSISDFIELSDNNSWKEKVSNKLEDETFVNNTIKSFNKKAISKKDLEKKIVSNR